MFLWTRVLVTTKVSFHTERYQRPWKCTLDPDSSWPTIGESSEYDKTDQFIILRGMILWSGPNRQTTVFPFFCIILLSVEKILFKVFLNRLKIRIFQKMFFLPLLNNVLLTSVFPKLKFSIIFWIAWKLEKYDIWENVFLTPVLSKLKFLKKSLNRLKARENQHMRKCFFDLWLRCVPRFGLSDVDYLGSN